MHKARNFQCKSDSECCVPRSNLIYPQATAGNRNSGIHKASWIRRADVHVIRDKLCCSEQQLSWSGKMIGVSGFSSQTLWKKGCHRQLQSQLLLGGQLYSAGTSNKRKWPPITWIYKVLTCVFYWLFLARPQRTFYTDEQLSLRTVLGFNWNSLKLPDVFLKGMIFLLRLD